MRRRDEREGRRKGTHEQRLLTEDREREQRRTEGKRTSWLGKKEGGWVEKRVGCWVLLGEEGRGNKGEGKRGVLAVEAKGEEEGARVEQQPRIAQFSSMKTRGGSEEKQREERGKFFLELWEGEKFFGGKVRSFERRSGRP